MAFTEVILVDADDNPTGRLEKMQAHQQGLLHRAFSIFIFNSKGEMLLQQRAMNKYHSGGLWTNACCSHPLPDESTALAAQRRLKEELGFETLIHKIVDFVYKADMGNGLTEHEFDHVFAGEYDGPVMFNKEEVMDCCYKSVEEIRDNLVTHPGKYTPWFHIAFSKMESWYNKEYKSKLA
ncbi:MAG TPA: isopentenyl-diphosphate Delta-isomerase [Chitinophagaceae bacterium]|jgi:isopentenyl-diphosphate delta-isomerase|nr:isopentenyl-diphosphate Delta-isomerase [Chitinophagaceae bacterium]